MKKERVNQLTPGYFVDSLAPHNEAIDKSLLRLYRCIFIQAVRDACDKQREAKHIYATWVLTSDCNLICDIIGVPYYDTVQYFKKISECEIFREKARHNIHFFKTKQNNQHTINKRK